MQWSLEVAKKRIAKAKSAKNTSDEIFREGMELCFPDREHFYGRRAEGQERAEINWDSAAQVSVIRAANRLGADFTTPFQAWFEITLGPAARMMSDDEFRKTANISREQAKRTLEQVSETVQAVFQSTGFSSAAHELSIDWLFGQGGMRIMPNPKLQAEPVIFRSMPLSEFYAEEGPNGMLDTWYLWHRVRADAIMQEWEDAELSDDLAREAAHDNPKMINLVSVCYHDYDEEVQPARYEVFYFKGDQRARIVARQDRTSPFVTPRYMKMAGENRGRGPVIFALPDIRTANKIVELTLRAVAIAVAGVYTATDDAAAGPIRIKPYSIIRVRRNGGPEGPALQRLDTAQDPAWGELVLEKLHENIKKIVGDNSLPPEAGPVRTATEFIERARELISDQAGGLGRLHAEFVVPAVQRVVDILEKRQMISTNGLKIDQYLVQVKMLSPLAQAENMAEVENIVRVTEILKLLVGDQMVGYHLDLDKLFTRLADLMSVPMSVRNTEIARMRMRQAAVGAIAAQTGGDPQAAQTAMQEIEQEGRNAA